MASKKNGNNPQHAVSFIAFRIARARSPGGCSSIRQF